MFAYAKEKGYEYLSVRRHSLQAPLLRYGPLGFEELRALIVFYCYVFHGRDADR